MFFERLSVHLVVPGRDLQGDLFLGLSFLFFFFPPGDFSKLQFADVNCNLQEGN